MQEVIIFNKVNSVFNYSGAEIARRSGLHRSLISRFLTGKTDISFSNFLTIVRSMPLEFQEAYWDELLGIKSAQALRSTRIPWTDLIAKASMSEIEEILNAIADRWAQLRKAKEQEVSVTR
ncbi:hypothetical protein [Coleofasciculus sp.]|jgi:transcriptional regulator with XRE-family HTH domain|uniref:hypothetical protein n=1 Tax=Coleofasciculus sp. TaxID=3100458 RepID=UPI0039FB6ED0